jgi:predicted DNA-binding WGR domain protein
VELVSARSSQNANPGLPMPDSATQLEVFPTELHLRRIDPARNMRRFYRMTIQPDLFGSASLIRTWGRIGTRGRQMIVTHPDEGRAISALLALAAEKRRRGYG